MQYFVTLIEEYVMYEVIQNQWIQFKAQLVRIQLFEELVDLHNNYLNTILSRCFLRGTVKDSQSESYLGEEKRLQSTLNLIFSQVFKLNHLIKEYGITICSAEEAETDIETITKHFKETSMALYTAVRNMAYKGQHQELFMKLDFNRFFAKQFPQRMQIK